MVLTDISYITIGDAFVLMQNNARANAGRVSMTFLDDEGISVTNWLTRSPDLNPVEHTWYILAGRIRRRQHYPENVQNLIDALVQELQAVPHEYATSSSGVGKR